MNISVAFTLDIFEFLCSHRPKWFKINKKQYGTNLIGPILLLSIAYKILERMIYLRILPVVEDVFSSKQDRF